MASYSRSRPWLSAIIVLLIGIAFLAGGARLAQLGDTWYYLLAGVGMLATALALFARRRAALWLYGLTWLGTLAWSLWEVGLDVWQLEPRLLLPTLLGLYLLMPHVRGTLGAPRRLSPVGYVLSPLIGAAIVGALFLAHDRPAPQSLPEPVAAVADNPERTPLSDAEWPYYGRSARGERWSPLDQITPQNVDRLKVAWEYRSGDLPKDGENSNGYEFNFEATPIKVGDSLYFCTPHRQIIALDAESGQERWRFDPQSETGNNAYLSCRGVSYYEAPKGSDTACPTRIISTTADARLMALNAENGKPCEDFGESGFVNLRNYLGKVPKGFHFISSPPLVAHDRLLLGGWIYDGQKTDEPSGAVRAFDPLTGELLWAWDVGHPDNPIVRPEPGQQFTRGTPNAWGVYTADLKRGIVYLPTGNSVPDYYGPDRRDFDEEYSSAVVALDITSGKPLWHFQTLHHDLWDMDVPIGPSLVDLPGNDGKTIPALVQTTKRGELFLLNRVTGEPLANVEEKPAPQGGLPGDPVAPTQPYSTGMPSFAPPKIQASDSWGVTPIDQMLCRIGFNQMNYEGANTPFSLDRKTLVNPAFDGVIDWQGASIDPERKRLYANLSYIPFVAEVYERKDAENQGLVKPWDGKGQPPKAESFSVNPQYGTPYVVKVDPWLGALGAPCKAPPWGQLAAVDLVQRKLDWKYDVGTTRDTGLFGTHFNLPLPTGIFNIAGNIVTRSGLIFMGATADDYLRAFDAGSGKELWKARLPAGGQATPMTYTGADGRQYLVISAGGHGGLGTRSGDYVIAYALPDASGS